MMSGVAAPRHDHKLCTHVVQSSSLRTTTLLNAHHSHSHQLIISCVCACGVCLCVMRWPAELRDKGPAEFPLTTKHRLYTEMRVRPITCVTSGKQVLIAATSHYLKGHHYPVS